MKRSIPSLFVPWIAVTVALSVVSCGLNKNGGQENDTGDVEVTEGKETATTENRSGPASRIGTIQSVTGDVLPSLENGDFSSALVAAPGFSWKNGAGEEGSLESYRGKVVMLNFWGTWCPPCRRELPDIVKLRNELGPKGFEVLGIALERPISGRTVEEHLADFAEANDLDYPMLLGSPELVERYGSSPYVPTTFIVDREGRISSVLVGGKSEEEFRKAIEAVL